jgi:predicted nuclease with TOPRIM domain
MDLLYFQPQHQFLTGCFGEKRVVWTTENTPTETETTVEDQIKGQKKAEPPKSLAEAGERIDKITAGNSILQKSFAIQNKWMPGALSGGAGILGKYGLLAVPGFMVGGVLGAGIGAGAAAKLDSGFHGNWNKERGSFRNIYLGAIDLFTPLKGKTALIESSVDQEVAERMGKKIEGEISGLSQRITQLSFLNLCDTSRKMLELSTKVEVCQDMGQQIDSLISEIKDQEGIYGKYYEALGDSNWWNKLRTAMPHKIGGFKKPSSEKVKEMEKLKTRVESIKTKTDAEKTDFDTRVNAKFSQHNAFREQLRDDFYKLIDTEKLKNEDKNKVKDKFDETLEKALLQRGSAGTALMQSFINKTFENSQSIKITDLQKMMPILCTFRGRAAYSFELSRQIEKRYSGKAINDVNRRILDVKYQKMSINIGKINLPDARCTGTFTTKEGINLPVYEGNNTVVYFNYSKDGKLTEIISHPKTTPTTPTTTKISDESEIIINPTTKKRTTETTSPPS